MSANNSVNLLAFSSVTSVVNVIRNSFPMKTYLVAWNPRKWEWKTILADVRAARNNEFFRFDWGCGLNKSIVPGVRIFLIRLGVEPKGIMASGFASTKPYRATHWGDARRTTNYILVDFDILLNPDKEPILPLDLLKVGNMAKQIWTPQVSGISIKPKAAEELEGLWFDFLQTEVKYNPFVPQKEITKDNYVEGTPQGILLTKYERNPFVKRMCMAEHGTACSVCGFDFELVYGTLGTDYIQVHHLLPISAIEKDYQADPVNDFRPVCANCHAMIHKEKVPLPIDELKSKLQIHAEVEKIPRAMNNEQ